MTNNSTSVASTQQAEQKKDGGATRSGCDVTNVKPIPVLQTDVMYVRWAPRDAGSCLKLLVAHPSHPSQTDSNFVLGNAQASGCPIVYCSDGFCELTGYARAQVMGKSCACKFLYGHKTVDGEKTKIDDALDNIEELKTEILLYRRNGVAFWCLMDIIPIKNEKSQVVLFLVSHKDISRDRSGSLEVPDKETSDESDGDEDYDENFRPPIPRCRAEMPTNCNYQRRRSRAVLYHLSGQFERQNRAKSKLQKFNKLTESISGKMPEYKVQEVKKSRYVIAHYGLFKIGWDWLIMLCTFYTAVMVPFNAAFITVDGNYRTSIHSDVVVEILFIIDIVLNFRTSFVSKSGQIVYDGRLIAVNYIRGWFLLDLLAAIPFDFLYTQDISTTTPVHLLKVARLLRLARLLQKIDRYSQYSAIVLALLMLLFALSAHWLACIWYAIGYYELEKNPPTWTTGWLYELSERLDKPINKTTKLPLLTSYITALYFTCSSLTSVGFGNVSANTDTEKIFSVCAMLVGAMMHAVVFGNVTAIIQRMYSRRANYHSRTKDLKDFFRTHRIPKPLKHRMQEYFQTMWSMNNGMETGEILKDFPDEMRGEICMHLHKDLLSLAIFENATQGCLKSISLQTRRAFSAPGEFLVHKGDAINYVYLLCSGTMEVLKQEMVVAILGKGDLFGADVNFEDPVGISCCDVRSLTYCELQGINLKGLCDVLTLYPDFAEKFAQDIRHDLTYNLKEGYEESDSDYEIKPIGRVITLPSISEDDEESDSDRDQVFNKGDNCSSPGSHRDNFRESSPSSPLLSEKTFSYNLPNGDIDGLSRFDREVTSPPSKRAITPSKRTITSNFRRSSLRERKRNVSGKSDLDRVAGMENLSMSLQNLKSDFEGTKSNIHQIEKKVDHIGSELSNMDEKLKSLLEILTPNPSVHSLSPPNTPFSPYTKPHFSFGSPTSEEDMLGSVKPNSTVVTSSLDVPYSSKRKYSLKDKNSACLQPNATNSACKDSGIKQRTNKSCDDIFQSGNDHQELERRHSDDVPYRKCTREQNGSAYKKPEGPVMFEYLSDIDRLRIHPSESLENKKPGIPIDKLPQSVHTISTGDCRKPVTMISRIPRNVIVQTQHSQNSKNILETTDL